MKVAIITDTHFGARNDSAHFDAHFKRFYEEVFFPFLDTQEIKTLWHLGDVFDRRKYINFNILKSCKQYFFEPLRSRGIEMYCIPGNHDTYYKNTNDTNSLDLLLGEYDNIKIISQPKVLSFDRRPFAFVPWICADNEVAVHDFLSQDHDPDTICLGHFEIDGYDMFRGVPNHGGLHADTLQQFASVFTGHFHHRSAEGNIYYLGSPYEFTWSDHDDPRGFHVFDTETTELTFIENPNTIFRKIYYTDTTPMPVVGDYSRSCVKLIVVKKDNYARFDRFVEALYQCDVAELTIHEDFSEFERAENVDQEVVTIEDTMTLLSEYVDTIETTKDTERLKTLLKVLYVEAQALEQ